MELYLYTGLVNCLPSQENRNNAHPWGNTKKRIVT